LYIKRERRALMSKTEIGLKGTLDADKASDYLLELAKSIKAGSVYVQKNGEFVNLVPSGKMDFEIKAKKKKHREKIEIEIGWDREKEQAIADGDLKISSPDKKK
jgi:amphi-Trp domain-containing protein